MMTINEKEELKLYSTEEYDVIAQEYVNNIHNNSQMIKSRMYLSDSDLQYYQNVLYDHDKKPYVIVYIPKIYLKL
jgi:hypothetical protein